MEKQSPLISVIMPLYNAERFVGESIENVLRQTVGDFELIVIDDASTDASAEIARAYAAKDNRIVLMHNELNSGAARTRNRALDAARGKFITFMDADDLCSPERFAKQLAFFERHPQTDICGSYYTMFGTRGGENDELKIQVPLTHEEIQYQLFFGCPFGMSSVMLRSEPFKRTGIRFRECMAEDYQLWVDLSEHLRMANIPSTADGKTKSRHANWTARPSAPSLPSRNNSRANWASGSRMTKPASSPVSPCGPGR